MFAEFEGGERGRPQGRHYRTEEETSPVSECVSGQDNPNTTFGPWMVAQKVRWQPHRSRMGNSSTTKEPSGISGKNQVDQNNQTDSTVSKMARSSKSVSLGTRSQGSRFIVLADKEGDNNNSEANREGVFHRAQFQARSQGG